MGIEMMMASSCTSTARASGGKVGVGRGVAVGGGGDTNSQAARQRVETSKKTQETDGNVNFTGSF